MTFSYALPSVALPVNSQLSALYNLEEKVANLPSPKRQNDVLQAIFERRMLLKDFEGAVLTALAFKPASFNFLTPFSKAPKEKAFLTLITTINEISLLRLLADSAESKNAKDMAFQKIAKFEFAKNLILDSINTILKITSDSVRDGELLEVVHQISDTGMQEWVASNIKNPGIRDKAYSDIVNNYVAQNKFKEAFSIAVNITNIQNMNKTIARIEQHVPSWQKMAEYAPKGTLRDHYAKKQAEMHLAGGNVQAALEAVEMMSNPNSVLLEIINLNPDPEIKLEIADRMLPGPQQDEIYMHVLYCFLLKKESDRALHIALQMTNWEKAMLAIVKSNQNPNVMENAAAWIRNPIQRKHAYSLLLQYHTQRADHAEMLRIKNIISDIH